MIFKLLYNNYIVQYLYITFKLLYNNYIYIYIRYLIVQILYNIIII